MWKFLSQYSLFLILSVVLHVLVIGVLVMGFESKPQQSKEYGVKKKNVIQAVAVDESRIQNELNKILAAEKKRKKTEARRQKTLQDQAKKAKANRIKEQRKLAALKKQQLQAQKKLKAQKQAEQKKLQALKKKQQQEQAKLKKLAADAAELKKKKVAEEKKLQQQKLKAAQLKRQQQLKKQMEAEERAERARELKGVTLSYIANIQAVVKGNWRRPATLSKNAKCKVYVKQIPGGEIIHRKVSECTGGSGFKRSVETALAKTSHLPAPPDPRVFDRDIVFTFKEK